MSGQANTTSMGRQGTVSFQANNMLDVFQVLEVYEPGVQPSEESLLNIEDPQFESDRAWVTGYVPKLVPTDVDGDTTVIHAWFKGDVFERNFTLRIYVEFEQAEEVIRDFEKHCEDREEPKEIFL